MTEITEHSQKIDLLQQGSALLNQIKEKAADLEYCNMNHIKNFLINHPLYQKDPFVSRDFNFNSFFKNLRSIKDQETCSGVNNAILKAEASQRQWYKENGAFGGKASKKSATSSCTKTSEKVTVGKREYCVYEGKRGGKYVKMNNEFVALKKALGKSSQK